MMQLNRSDAAPSHSTVNGETGRVPVIDAHAKPLEETGNLFRDSNDGMDLPDRCVVYRIRRSFDIER